MLQYISAAPAYFRPITDSASFSLIYEASVAVMFVKQLRGDTIRRSSSNEAWATTALITLAIY